MLAISCEEMKAMDFYAIEKIGIPSIVLMENAALRVIDNIDLDRMNSITLICGVGNNGGDGLAIARHLIINRKNVDLFIVGNLDKGTKDFNINLNILKNMELKFIHITGEKELEILKKSLVKNDLTIDSIFGIGLTRDVEDIYKEVISLINHYSNNILSVDIPSGLDGDTGEILGISVKSNKTITFHLIKKGLLESKEYTGEIIVEPIGIPEKVTKVILERMD
ncbi:NAD(P)H-hydrate epimerase [uncultured Tissierella sp.]|uniref:NAD(P)H-hydrate epimerase n=1 Tax=uncultured Tissierella sp. TaxID=448160 RepID=UPI002803BF50|nr:NAD(P)H-hydrate epimerase [uncultured Tissierella sp.]MDU5083108.1 NAD(P)H-hydrate epimerase [Bacillota bacterium]